MPGELAQQQASQGSFRLSRLPDHHDSGGTVGSQLIDLLDEFEREVPGRQGDVNDGDPGANQLVKELSGFRARSQLVDKRRVLDDQTDGRSLPLDQGVGALRRRVPDVLGLVQQPDEVLVAVERGGGLLDTVEETLGQVERCRQGLGEGELLPVPDTDVGEGAPVVDVDEVIHASPFGRVVVVGAGPAPALFEPDGNCRCPRL